MVKRSTRIQQQDLGLHILQTIHFYKMNKTKKSGRDIPYGKAVKVLFEKE